jgi:hypothetical protein
MNTNDVQQKIALLPEGLTEENVLSWQHILKLFELFNSHNGGDRYKPFVELIGTIYKSDQAKLFRAGVSAAVLMISTKEKHGLEQGDAYIFIGSRIETVDIGYFTATAHEAEVINCKNDEIMSTLKPLLDRLWSETRGKKNT